ncbi:MAG: glycine cleavage system aminomethyltransferase GcvT [Flavobacteriales bacterium]
MKDTPLTPEHEKLDAKLVEFAGFRMPVQYVGVTEEHHAVRERAGIFDVSHMGEFIIHGAQALDLIQKVSSNDASSLHPGKAQYSCMPNLQGGIVDDLIVYMLEEDRYMLVVNAANIEKDREWILSWNHYEATLEDGSERTSLIALQGPRSPEILRSLTKTDIDAIEFYHFEKGSVNGIQDVIISATGYTGEKGFELYCPSEAAPSIWNALMEEGKAFDIQPAGLAARDTLRLEAGLCLYGNDIDDNTSPLEARLSWITKFTKDFVNRAALEAQKANGITRKLVGFELLEKGIARHGYNIKDENGTIIGRVTSGTMSPTLQKPIGMGFVQKGYDQPGTGIFIEIRGKQRQAEVVKMPFLKR